MNIRWKLRMAAAQREVWTGTQLRRLLAEKAGLELSAASVSALFTKEPAQVKLSTLAALCTALECTPNDLFEVDTTPVAAARRPAAAGGGPAEGRAGPGPVDAAALTSAGPMGKETAGLRRLRRAGRHHRPRTLLPVLAEDHRGRGKDGVPRVREAAGPAGRHGPVRAVLPRLPRVRAPGPRPGGRRCAGTAGARPGRPRPSGPARGAAGPGICARTPAGAARAPGPRQPKDPPRACAQCGQVKRHEGLGLCSACWQRRPGPALRPGRVTWPPGSPTRPAGWTASSPTWPPGTRRPGPAR